MAVPKKRTTRGAQGQRRSHHALKPVQLQTASNGALVPRRLIKAVSLGLIKTRDR
jgi:hypothetical protein